MAEPTPNPTPNPTPPPADHAKDIADLKAANAELKSHLEKLQGKPAPEGDLSDKAKLDREAEEKKGSDTKALENAIRFNMGAKEFLTTNASLLPKSVSGIFEAAEKENWKSAIEKDGAIKAGIIKEFFGVQSNLDLLTPSLKNHLEDYLKLTNTGRQEKAQGIFDSVFEPAFEMLRRVKKAEALGKGHGGGSNAESAYKEKLIQGSKKHYLGEKSNA